MVVDAQVGVMRQAWDAQRIVTNIARAVARAREAGAPVLWVQHTDDELPRGSAAWQWVPQLVPAAGEPRIEKRYNSAFEQTELEPVLAGLGATHVVLAGAASNWCIRATVHAALERGYDLTLLGDAHTTESMQLDDGTTVAAADIVRELNIAAAWLEYPGRANATAAAAAVDYTVPPRSA